MNNGFTLQKKYMCSMLSLNSLETIILLDIGSGSGLFSLVARRMGAKVHSFNYGLNYLACIAQLKKRFFDSDTSSLLKSLVC